jgi:hypothetical protein
MVSLTQPSFGCNNSRTLLEQRQMVFKTQLFPISDAITAEATTRAAITAETLARTTADVFKTQLFYDAITAETLARTNTDGLKTQLFLIIRMQ